MTDPSRESVYSGEVSLRSLRLAIFLGELNDVSIMVADVGNAYLEAKTKEKVYIIAGPEFGELEGHTLVIYKALYGLRTSGARFHERFADTLRDMGFVPCDADPDVWMRDSGDLWEFVCVYTDDLCAIMKDPQAFFNQLSSSPHHYKTKGCRGDLLPSRRRLWSRS
jgi:Reverse transcriptase (RNA-dependent DNA polymerase)